MIERDDIQSGGWNLVFDEAHSLHNVISNLAKSQYTKPKICTVPKGLVKSLTKLKKILWLPLTTERPHKPTESYMVSNQKIKSAIGKVLPVTAKDGLIKTFKSFNNIK